MPQPCIQVPDLSNQVTHRNVDCFVNRAYHNATIKMTRRAYIFDGEFVLLCCLG